MLGIFNFSFPFARSYIEIRDKNFYVVENLDEILVV